MIFVLSTGRCGSMTITSVLSQFTGVECYHEPEPKLAKEAYDYLTGRMRRAELADLLRQTRRARMPGNIYAESNQKLSYMVDALLEAFPAARFIWLVRNGLDVVASLEHRRTYRRTRGEWNVYRLRGDELGDVDPRQWRRMTAFAKCCWYWRWTNERIERDLEAAGADYIVVKLEELADNIGAIGEWLGIPAHGVTVPVANAHAGRVSGAEYWDRRQRRDFADWCGPIMDELYPGWRARLVLNAGKTFRNELLSLLSYRTWTGRMLRTAGAVLPESVRRGVAAKLQGKGVANFEYKGEKAQLDNASAAQARDPVDS